MSNPTSVSHRTNISAVPISGCLHGASNGVRTPNFPADLCQPTQQMSISQSSRPLPGELRDVRVLTVDLVNNIPYKHWATGWRQDPGPIQLPDYTTTPCSSIDVLNTLEKGSIGWWQEILSISAEELYYAKQDNGEQDNGDQATNADLERTTGSTETATYQGYLELPDRPAAPVCQSHPEYPRPAPERKTMSRAAMAEIATDIMATWASAERRVMIRDLIGEQPNQPEEMDEGLFVYHTDADKVALRKRFDASYASGFKEGRQMALQHEEMETSIMEDRAAWLAEQLEIEREQELAHDMENLRIRENEMVEKQRQEALSQGRLEEQERLKLLQLADEQKDEKLWDIRIAIRNQNIPWRHLVLLYAKIDELKSVDCTCPSPYCLKRSLKPQRKLLKSTYNRIESQYDQQHESILRTIEEYQTRRNPDGCPVKRMELEAVIDEIQEEEFQNLEHILDDVDGILKGVTPLLAIDFWHLCTKRGVDLVLHPVS